MLAAEFNEPLADQIFSPVDVFGFGISLIPPANSVDRFVSLLHFSIDFTRIRNTIGCKSETKYTKIERLDWLEKNGENKKERYNKKFKVVAFPV